MLFSFIPTSQAELLDFIVELDMDKEAIHSGDTIVVTGRVVNHAYEPTRGVEVLIRTGTDTIKTFTDPSGNFRGEFKDFQRVPGTYIVNVVASWYGMTGLASTEFLVKGDSTPVLILQQQLSTEEAKKYLGSNEGDFEKNPIGQTLFKHYHKLNEQLINEIKKASEPSDYQLYMKEQRELSNKLRMDAIEKHRPGSGIFDGYQYEYYINSLNPEIRELIGKQLNYTKNSFEKAQILRNEIIANGGTFEEARQAYLEMFSMPKHILDKFNEKYLNKDVEKDTDKDIQDVEKDTDKVKKDTDKDIQEN